MLLILGSVAGVAFYFAPDNIKERGLAYIDEQKFIPAEIKKAAEDIYATPEYKRDKLLAELESNFASLESAIIKSSPQPEEAVKTIARTKEIIKEISEISTNPTLVSKITEIVTEKVLSTVKVNNSCPTP
ncbi:MAG: hypothetical protein Q7S83_03795 [bacterium]|nr:hypothetical protein [bacterium]